MSVLVTFNSDFKVTTVFDVKISKTAFYSQSYYRTLIGNHTSNGTVFGDLE